MSPSAVSARQSDQPLAPQPTSPGRWGTVGAIAAGVLALGMVAGAGLWLTAAISVVAVIAIGHAVAASWSNNLVAVRVDEPDASGDWEFAIGSKIPMAIEVTNRGRLPVAWVLVEDLLPTAAPAGPLSSTENASTPRSLDGYRRPPLRVLGRRLAVMTLMPGQTKTLAYEIETTRRGYFQVGPTVLETGDPVGLFRRYRLATNPHYLTVLPRVEGLTSYEIGSRRPIGEIRIRENVMTDPTRIRGIRQWQIGDPMRSVHWAATARTGILHSKIYEPSSIVGATIVLDLHVNSNPERHEPVRTDLAISAAASIAAALHQAGEPFALATNGRDAADRIRAAREQASRYRTRDSAASEGSMHRHSDRLRPVILPVDRGPTHLREVTRHLARLERTDGLTLAEFLAESQSQLSDETTLLFIVQSVSETDLAAMIGFARRGWAVAVIVNTAEIHEFSQVAAPLLAENLSVAHLADRQSIGDLAARPWSLAR